MSEPKFKTGDRVGYEIRIGDIRRGKIVSVKRDPIHGGTPFIYTVLITHTGRTDYISTIYPDRLTLLANGLQKLRKLNHEQTKI